MIAGWGYLDDAWEDSVFAFFDFTFIFAFLHELDEVIEEVINDVRREDFNTVVFSVFLSVWQDFDIECEHACVFLSAFRWVVCEDGLQRL